MRRMERLNKSCPRLRGKLLVSGTIKRLPGRGAGNTPQGGLTEGLTIPSEATFFFNPSVCSLHSHPPPLSGQAYCVELALTKTLPTNLRHLSVISD